jgi:stearoyl-CoA desaturase (delta-9 desaturase)
VSTTSTSIRTAPSAASGSRTSAGSCGITPSGEVDFSNVRDLQRDPLVAFQHKYYIPLTLAMNVGLPLALGAIFNDLWGVFLLAGILRLVINHHVTFFINSLAHMWGTQPYTDENTARDNHSARVHHVR